MRTKAIIKKRPAAPTASVGKTSDPKAVQKLELLILVVNRNKTEFYIDFLHNFEINLHTIMPAHGTAKTEMLEYLGLMDDDKAVIFNIIREDQVANTLAALDEKFHTIRNGKGISFAIPLSSVIGVNLYRFFSDRREV
jgi:nitrogen regulatory protein PII